MDINAIKNELEAKAYAKITVSPSNLSFNKELKNSAPSWEDLHKIYDGKR